MKANDVKDCNNVTAKPKKIKVSLFKDNLGLVRDEITLIEILEAIKTGSYLADKRRTEAIRESTTKFDKDLFKKTLYGFTPSGTFNKRRTNETLIQHTGLLNIDIDVKDNPEFFKDEERVNKMIEALKKYDFCISFWRTAGNGFSILFKINPDQHLECFYDLKYIFHTKSIKIDSNCKDIPRLRNINYDAGIYINPALYNERDYDAIEAHDAQPYHVQQCLELDAQDILAKQNKAFKERKNSLNGIDIPVDPDAVGKAISSDLVPAAVQMAVNYCKREGATFISGNRLNYILKITALLNQIGVEVSAGYKELCKHIDLDKHMDHSYNFHYIYRRNKSCFAKSPFIPNIQATQEKLVSVGFIAKEEDSQRKRVVLPTGKRISDIDLDLTSKRIVLISPTNSGKSYKFLKSGDKIDFLVPYVDLAKQIGAEYKKHVVYEGVQINEDDIQVGTYNAIEKMANSYARTKDRVLVIDEAHKLVLDAAKSFRNKTVNKLLDAAKKYKQVILLTGTYIENKHPFFKDAEFIEVVRKEPVKKPFEFVEYKNKMESVEKRLIRNKLNIVFINSLSDCEILQEFLNGNGYKTQVFNSTTKEELEHSGILEQQKIKEDVEVLITTNLFCEGLNIYNTNISSLHVVSQENEFVIEQLVNRTRNKTAENIYIYTSKISNVKESFDIISEQEKLIIKAKEAIKILGAIREYGSVNDLELLLKDTYKYLSGMADCIKIETDSEGKDYYDLDYLSIANRVVKSKTYANYRYMQMFISSLAKFGFTYAGTEKDAEANEKTKTTIATAKERAKRNSENELKEMLDGFEIEGYEYVEAMNSETEKDRIKADLAYKVSRLTQYVSFADAIKLVREIKSSTAGFNKVLRQLKNMKINMFLNSGAFNVDTGSAEYKVYKNISSGFKIGERLSSNQIKERVEQIFKQHQLLNLSEVTTTRSTQILKEFYGVRKVKEKADDGKRKDYYEITSHNPLDVAIVENQPFHTKYKADSFNMADLDFTSLFDDLEMVSAA